MAEKIFRADFLPSVENTPAEKTHKRARLIYNLLRVLVYFTPAKQAAALKELKEANSILFARVHKYLQELPIEEIVFFKGPRPTCHEDGTLAIYHPVRDNPLLMRVYIGEEPSDASRIWTPGTPIGSELSALRSSGRVVVGRN